MLPWKAVTTTSSTTSTQDTNSQWRKSSFSGGPNGNCVEVAQMSNGDIAVRNSRDPQDPTLIYTRAEIAAFLARAKNGEFDDLTA